MMEQVPQVSNRTLFSGDGGEQSLDGKEGKEDDNEVAPDEPSNSLSDQGMTTGDVNDGPSYDAACEGDGTEADSLSDTVAGISNLPVEADRPVLRNVEGISVLEECVDTVESALGSLDTTTEHQLAINNEALINAVNSFKMNCISVLYEIATRLEVLERNQRRLMRHCGLRKRPRSLMSP